MSLGDNIKKYRELQNLSIPALAEKMGIGKAGVYKWEAGENKPGQESLTALAQALNVSVSDLLDENPTPAIKSSNHTESDREQVYRRLIEENSEYWIMPRTVLEGEYRLYAVSQIETLKKEREEAMSDKKEALAAKNELIQTQRDTIKHLRQDLDKVITEYDKLKASLSMKPVPDPQVS
jgi:transcriptional regulator with XRE-family HTH domain